MNEKEIGKDILLYFPLSFLLPAAIILFALMVLQIVPFGNYSFGDPITENAYNALSAADKAKCTSAIINLTFDPSIILVDITSDFYENSYSNTTQLINNKAYVNGITFGMDPVSSMTIRFYKVNASNNYTYPTLTNPNSIITFTAL